MVGTLFSTESNMQILWYRLIKINSVSSYYKCLLQHVPPPRSAHASWEMKHEVEREGE
jgi:hypothetical protein